jgi:hypothetical protein
MTQWRFMNRIGAGALVTGLLLAPLAAQKPAVAESEPVAVFTDHPRLFLRPARLRLLRRERERASMRWQQFETYLSAGATMPEPGFADALYYQVSADANAGRRAIQWALEPGADLRQMSLVFDWCQDLLTAAQRRDLVGRISERLAQTAADNSVPAVASRVLAAVALFDEVPRTPNQELERMVRSWWGGTTAPALARGQAVIAREDAYAFWEMLHAIRDSTNIDLREGAPQYFKEFPIEHLISHYPAAFRGEDNDFRIGAAAKTGGEPDVRQAALSRAAELAMVAYDSNAEESQFLQGWLMHDNFMLRGTFGVPYEFLWANPYQPGLSFTHVPLIFHSAESGRLFVRSDWEDSADWFGYFDGSAQLFHDGRVMSIDRATAEPLVLASAVIYFGQRARKFRVRLEEDQQAVILVGLMAHRTYQVEVDDEEVSEEATDSGGILLLELPRGKEIGVRLRETPQTQ